MQTVGVWFKAAEMEGTQTQSLGRFQRQTGIATAQNQVWEDYT